MSNNQGSRSHKHPRRESGFVSRAQAAIEFGLGLSFLEHLSDGVLESGPIKCL